MMSRSRRLFVLLLHLIGCQHYYLHPSLLTLNQTAGIVGVQPWPIVLEKVLDPSTLFSSSGKKHRRRRRRRHRRRVPHSSLYDDENDNNNSDDDDEEQEKEEAFWLQDEVTGTCLGPTARLTLCGDATLWWVAKRKNNHVKKRRLKMGIWGADEEKATTTTGSSINKEALAFYVVDRNVPIGTVAATAATSSSSSKEGNSRSNENIQLFTWWERALLGARGLGYQEQQEELPVPMDCLVVANHQDDDDDDEKRSSGSHVAVQKCTQTSQWAWAMNEQWGLHPVLDEEATAAALSSSSSTSTLPLGNVCLVREDSSSSVPKLAPCHENDDASGAAAERLMRLSLVRYRAITLPEAAARTTSSSATNSATEGAAMMKNKSTTVASSSSSSTTTRLQASPSSTRGNGMKNNQVEATSVETMATRASQTLSRSNSPAPFQQRLEEQKQPSASPTRQDVERSNPLPSNKDLAHKHASSVSAMHPELHLSSRLTFHHSSPQKTSTTPTIDSITKRAQESLPSPSPQHQSQERPVSSKMSKKKSPFLLRALDDTNPILFTGKQNDKKEKCRQKSMRVLAHPEAGSEQDGSSNPMRRRTNIPIHPYIAESVNEVWTDPQTSLTYPTDLSGYLGRDRKTHGRHTLMGVGQFRKGYVIKVYGVAVYVSKRDVLSDPFFKPFAHMTAAELRQEPEFYRHLRVDAHNFERTIVIKTNMQLPAAVMRNSLQYDWKMLTEEAKSTLINSSMQPRPADDEMLQFIQSAENPGRCSCSQVAPEEYQADPECCARGTELVFTWLKTGDLEIRLSGRLVDTFSRPDIAEGIFFEYLRTDDPMTPELIDNVVKGFPFLLAPLDQVKGVKIGQSHQQSPSSKPDEHENSLIRAATEMADAIVTNAMVMAGAVQHAAADAAEHASNVARFMGDSARNLSREANHAREVLMKRASSMPDMFMKILSREQDPITTVTEWVESNFTPTQDELDFPERRLSSGRVFGYPLSRWFDEVYYAPDEIGPMVVTPTMNGTRKMFLYLVHLYLLLLFIVSFPGSYITRTKPIRKRSHLTRQSSDESTVKRAHTTIKNTTAAVTVLMDKTTRGLNAFPDIARSSQDRLHCQERTYSRGFLPATSKFPSNDKNLCNDSSGRLKKKSLSYFL